MNQGLAKYIYFNTVNMTHDDMIAWAANPLSNLAGTSREPIDTNLRLLNKKHATWSDKDIKDAKRIVSFIKKAKTKKLGKPLSKTIKLSKQEAVLRNYGFNPPETPRLQEDFGIKSNHDFKGKLYEYRAKHLQGKLDKHMISNPRFHHIEHVSLLKTAELLLKRAADKAIGKHPLSFPRRHDMEMAAKLVANKEITPEQFMLVHKENFPVPPPMSIAEKIRNEMRQMRALDKRPIDNVVYGQDMGYGGKPGVRFDLEDQMASEKSMRDQFMHELKRKHESALGYDNWHMTEDQAIKNAAKPQLISTILQKLHKYRYPIAGGVAALGIPALAYALSKKPNEQQTIQPTQAS